MGVKVGQGKALGVPEQVGADFAHHLLGNMDHHLIVGITGECAAQVQPSHDQQHVLQAPGMSPGRMKRLMTGFNMYVPEMLDRALTATRRAMTSIYHLCRPR